MNPALRSHRHRDHIGIDGHYAFHLPTWAGYRPLRDPDSADGD